MVLLCMIYQCVHDMGPYAAVLIYCIPEKDFAAISVCFDIVCFDVFLIYDFGVCCCSGSNDSFC